MKNILEKYRVSNSLTYRGLAKRCGSRSLNAVFRHCHGQLISAESAMVYSKSLGIPLCDLRPDLWPPDEPKPAREKTEA